MKQIATWIICGMSIPGKENTHAKAQDKSIHSIWETANRSVWLVKATESIVTGDDIRQVTTMASQM